MEKIEFVDSHVHLFDYKNDELTNILQESLQTGLKFIVNNATQEQNFQDVEKLSNQYSDLIIPSYGIHPWYVQNISENWKQNLINFLQKDKQNLVGEIGLDFAKKDIDKKVQQDIFLQQLEIAIDLQRPVSIHCVRAQGEMLKIFKKVLKKQEYKPNIIMHSYGGSKEMTEAYLKLNANMYFSLSLGIVKSLDKVDCIPIENIIVETDSPHQLYRELIEKSHGTKYLSEGQLNSPKYLPILIQELANCKKLNLLEFSNIIFQNSLKAFNLIAKKI